MKSTFQLQKPRVEFVAEMVANPMFKEAVSFVISEYSSMVAGSPESGAKITGAIQALQVLSELAEPTVKPKTSAKRLNYSQ